MKVRKLSTVSALAVVIAASSLLVSACMPGAPGATWWNGNVDREAEVFFENNIAHARGHHGLGGLQLHGALTDKARRWSQRMADGTCSPGRICHSQLTDGVQGHVASWSLLGENVGVGANLQSIWTTFLNSPAHRANILDGRWDHYGVGVVRGGGTYWVTMVFMRS